MRRERIFITDVSPRDGLQNQAVPWVPGRIFCNGAGWYLAGVNTLRLCPLSCDAAESSGESPLVTVPCP